MSADPGGWSWFELADQAEIDASPIELCRVFARCFAGRDGELALQHLERTFLERRLPPEASDAALRHLEGQRFAIAHIRSLIQRGQR